MAERICSIDGCERVHAARGWCHNHYYQWKRTGDPLGRATPKAKPPCTIDGCNQPNCARGLCNMHYSRLRANGDPLHTRSTIAERLNARLAPSLTFGYNGTPCQEWHGARLPRGYGKIGDRRQRGTGWALTHRIAYELAFGTPPSDQLVCHHCDNPPCCNPAHLFLGDHTTNVHDMWAKGRQKMPWSP